MNLGQGIGRILPDGSMLVALDFSPGSDAYSEFLWSDPRSTRNHLLEGLGDDRQRVGVLLPGHVVMADVSDPEPTRDLATVNPGLMLLAPVGLQVRWPGQDARIEQVDGNSIVVALDQGDTTFTVQGIDPSVAVGDLVSASSLLGTVSSRTDESVLGSRVIIVPNCGSDPFEYLTPETYAARRNSIGAAFVAIGIHGFSEPVTSPEIVELRDRRLARSQRAYYGRPPAFVRGKGVWMYDEYGHAYLDTINNVTHVGHSNPRITKVASRQLAKLNTNSRFVYRGLADYADALVSTLPDPLEVVFFVCTGSEANDLALRISRQVTGRRDVVILDGAYHGNTTAVMEISPNRYKGPGGRGKPDTTHELETPNLYRGSYRYDDGDAGRKYAADAAGIFQELDVRGQQPAAFIAESLMGTAGNVVLPDGYLHDVFGAARKHGALCISDEVQVGAARFGNHYWGFQDQGVVPDIVTMGKPIGNGHPMAAVVTTREIAQTFDDGVKYFNTFAGNPVSCAIGLEVLQIIEDEDLQGNARVVGEHLLTNLQELMNRHEIVGDVRGKGLYMGIELVRDRETQEPAKEEAYRISEELLQHGVISYPTGQYDNVLKVKPPMVFDKSHADFFVEALDRVLSSPQQFLSTQQ